MESSGSAARTQEGSRRGSSSPWDLHPPDFPPHRCQPKASSSSVAPSKHEARAQPGTRCSRRVYRRPGHMKSLPTTQFPEFTMAAASTHPAASACTLTPGNRPALQGHMSRTREAALLSPSPLSRASATCRPAPPLPCRYSARATRLQSIWLCMMKIS